MTIGEGEVGVHLPTTHEPRQERWEELAVDAAGS